MSKLRCLVTGGAGFIGSHLVAALAADGHQVRVFDDLSSGRQENLGQVASDVRLLQGDIRDLAALRAAADGVDVIFHLAAIASVRRSLEEPATTLDINVKGTQNALEAARLAGVRRVVFASSAAVYGAETAMPLRESMPTRPISHYGAHKLMGERLCDVYGHLYGLETVALRYFNVYGPRQNPHSEYAAVIPRFAALLRGGGTPTIYGDGTQTRDFIHVSDVARANLLAATADAAIGGVFNLGSGERTSISDLLRVMGEVVGSPVTPRHAPARAGDIRESVASVTLLRATLGFTPQVSLRDGLAGLLHEDQPGARDAGEARATHD